LVLLNIMEISSLADLENVEFQIASICRNLKLGDVLHSLYLLKKQDPKLQPFMVAGVALFAVRFCHPSKVSQRIKDYNVRHLVNLSNQYYLADPITFDKTLSDEFIDTNPVFMMLRLVSSQFPFDPGLFSEFSRPALLFDEIPKYLQGLPDVDVPQFDFESNFQSLTKVSVLDFITTGFVISAASHSNFAVTQDYFKKVRKQGINLPDDQTVKLILNQLAERKFELLELYKKRKNLDCRFRMYDFNPLLSYPIIRPCQDKQFSTSDKDFIHAPVPELIGSRISTGIYYQMYNEYSNKFSEYFGYVFENYVGLVLKNCLISEQLLSESDIRKFYPTKKGKVPDWVLIDGSIAILIECKATRFSRAAQAIASEEEINKSLAQVKKGLKQLHSFISACQAKVPELEQFHNCKIFKPVLVSLEPLYLINSTSFREYINNLLASEKITEFSWQILSINELEVLQPHIVAGFSLSKVLDDLLDKGFNDTLQELIVQTNRTFADSFLYQKQEELYQRLSIPDRIIPKKI